MSWPLIAGSGWRTDVGDACIQSHKYGWHKGITIHSIPPSSVLLVHSHIVLDSRYYHNYVCASTAEAILLYSTNQPATAALHNIIMPFPTFVQRDTLRQKWLITSRIPFRFRPPHHHLIQLNSQFGDIWLLRKTKTFLWFSVTPRLDAVRGGLRTPAGHYKRPNVI